MASHGASRQSSFWMFETKVEAAGEDRALLSRLNTWFEEQTYASEILLF